VWKVPNDGGETNFVNLTVRVISISLTSSTCSSTNCSPHSRRNEHKFVTAVSEGANNSGDETIKAF